MVVLPYFLHNILTVRVLTPSVAVSPPGESLTLDHTIAWLRVILPFLFKCDPFCSLKWLGHSAESEQI